MSKYQFSPDFEYLYINNDDGSITGIPTSELTDEEKKALYEEIYE